MIPSINRFLVTGRMPGEEPLPYVKRGRKTVIAGVVMACHASMIIIPMIFFAISEMMRPPVYVMRLPIVESVPNENPEMSEHPSQLAPKSQDTPDKGKPLSEIPKIPDLVKPVNPSPSVSKPKPQVKPIEKKSDPVPVKKKPKPQVKKKPEPTPVKKKPEPTPVKKKPEPTPVKKKPEPTPVKKKPEPTPVKKKPEPTPVTSKPDPVKPAPVPESKKTAPVQSESKPQKTLLDASDIKISTKRVKNPHQPSASRSAQTTRPVQSNHSAQSADTSAADNARNARMNELARQLRSMTGTSGGTGTPGGGSGPTGIVSKAVSDYYDKVESYLKRRWDQPTVYGDSRPKVIILFRVAADGRIISAVIQERSGNAAMDTSVENLLKSLQTLPAPPQAMSFTVTMEIER